MDSVTHVVVRVYSLNVMADAIDALLSWCFSEAPFELVHAAL